MIGIYMNLVQMEGNEDLLVPALRYDDETLLWGDEERPTTRVKEQCRMHELDMCGCERGWWFESIDIMENGDAV